MEYHSLSVGDRKKCDETAFHKMWNVTHSLLVIGKDVMRQPSTTYGMLLAPSSANMAKV